MAGIDSIINTRADAFANNPQGLMQRYAMNQDLLDLLALQKLKQDKEAAQRSLQMQMQAPQNTVKDQLEGQVMDMTRQEVAQAVAPGLQQQGQRMQAEQLQQAMGAGLGGLPAPAGLGMAQGGIVGYAGPEGSRVRAMSRRDFDARQAQANLENVRRIRNIVYNRNAEQNAEPGFWQRVNEAMGNAAIAEGGMGVPDVLPPDFWQRVNEAMGNAAIAEGGMGVPDVLPPDFWQRVNEAMGNAAIAEGGMGVPDVLPPDFWQRVNEAMGNAAIAEGGMGVPDVLPPDFWQRVNEAMGNAAIAEGGMGVSADDVAADDVAADDVAADDVAADDVAADEVTTRPTRLPPGTRSPGLAMSSDQMNNLLTPPTTDTSTQAPAAPEQQDPRISRWEKQLEELEAEKGSKTSALIDFLLAAGASGGTNLGATLTGGGSGLRARDARLAGQEADIIKNIETLNLENQRLAQQESQFKRGQTFEAEQGRLDREARVQEAEAAANAAIAKAQFEFDQYVDEAERELNRAAAERTLQNPEYTEARDDIMEKYAGGFFKGANPNQAAAEIAALYRTYFSQTKRELTGMGMSGTGAGVRSSGYITP